MHTRLTVIRHAGAAAVRKKAAAEGVICCLHGVHSPFLPSFSAAATTSLLSVCHLQQQRLPAAIAAMPVSAAPTAGAAQVSAALSRATPAARQADNWLQVLYKEAVRGSSVAAALRETSAAAATDVRSFFFGFWRMENTRERWLVDENLRRDASSSTCRSLRPAAADVVAAAKRDRGRRGASGRRGFSIVRPAAAQEDPHDNSSTESPVPRCSGIAAALPVAAVPAAAESAAAPPAGSPPASPAVEVPAEAPPAGFPAAAPTAGPGAASGGGSAAAPVALAVTTPAAAAAPPIATPAVCRAAAVTPAASAAYAAAVEDLRKRVLQAASEFKSPTFREYFQRRALEDFDKMQQDLPTAREKDVQNFLKEMEAHCALLQRQSKVANIYYVDKMVYLK